MPNRSSRLFGGTVCTHHAVRVNLTEIRCYIGKVGADAFGDFMRNRLQEAGIDTSAVVVDPDVKTGLTAHLVRGANRAMLTYPGSIAALGPEELHVSVSAAPVMYMWAAISCRKASSVVYRSSSSVFGRLALPLRSIQAGTLRRAGTRDCVKSCPIPTSSCPTSRSFWLWPGNPP